MSFKFGRKYHIEWTPVNIDFASLYAGTINPCMEVVLDDERFKDRIILRRSDLSRGSLNEPRETVGLCDISSMSLSRNKINRASIIIFLDDNGQTKVLKTDTEENNIKFK
jgi:hypothetical protein